MPSPFSLNSWCWPLQVTDETAWAGPAAEGENVKNIWHDSPGSRVLAWQFCAALKGAETPPPAPFIRMATSETFVMSAVSWTEVPIWTSPNSNDVGDMSSGSGS